MSATLNFVELRKLIVQVWSLAECVCSFCVAAWVWAPALCALSVLIAWRLAGL